MATAFGNNDDVLAVGTSDDLPQLVEIRQRIAIGWDRVAEVEQRTDRGACAYAVDDLQDLRTRKTLMLLQKEANAQSGSQLRCILELFDCGPDDFLDRSPSS